MANNNNHQLIQNIKGIEFGLQVYGATDNNKDFHFLYYVLFKDDNNIKKDFGIKGSDPARDSLNIYIGQK